MFLIFSLYVIFILHWETAFKLFSKIFWSVFWIVSSLLNCLIFNFYQENKFKIFLGSSGIGVHRVSAWFSRPTGCVVHATPLIIWPVSPVSTVSVSWVPASSFRYRTTACSASSTTWSLCVAKTVSCVISCINWPRNVD